MRYEGCDDLLKQVLDISYLMTKLKIKDWLMHVCNCKLPKDTYITWYVYVTRFLLFVVFLLNKRRCDIYDHETAIHITNVHIDGIIHMFIFLFSHFIFILRVHLIKHVSCLPTILYFLQLHWCKNLNDICLSFQAWYPRKIYDYSE